MGPSTESWTCGGEEPSQYRHDQLEARLDWNGDPAELEREEDDVNKKDHEALYSKLDDYPADMPDLEESDSVKTPIYDQLAATPTSTTISTDTEVAGDMLNLNMDLPELLAPQEANDLVAETDGTLSDDNPLADMFKVPAKAPVPWQSLPSRPRLDP